MALVSHHAFDQCVRDIAFKGLLRQYIVRLAAIGFISTQIKRKSVDREVRERRGVVAEVFRSLPEARLFFEQSGNGGIGGFVMPTLDQEQSRLGILHACPRTAPVLIIVSAASAKRTLWRTAPNSRPSS
jgi:hypothetical protein